MRIHRIYAAFALVVAGVVSTVGSGGGSGWGVGESTLPEIPEIITTANAQDVTAMVVRADDQAVGMITKIAGQAFPSLPSAPNLLSSNSKFSLFETVIAKGQPVTETCAVSGTVTVSGRPENDPVSLSTLDVFDLVFDTCDDGDGYTLDGSFSLTVYFPFEGDDYHTDVFRLFYAMQDMTLTVASGITKYTASSPDLAISWSSFNFPQIELYITPAFPPGMPLQLSSQADVYTLGNYSQLLTLNADPSVSMTLREVGEHTNVTSTLFDRISYYTKVPLQAPDGQDPQSGEILITDFITDIHVVIESSDAVRLDIVRDGVTVDTQYTTWAALRG